MPSDDFAIREYHDACKKAGKTFAWVYCGLALFAALLGDVWPGSAPGTSKLFHAGFALCCAGLVITFTPGMLVGLRWSAVAATWSGLLVAIVLLVWGIRMVVDFPELFRSRRMVSPPGSFVPVIFVVWTLVQTWDAGFQMKRPQPEDLLANADPDLAVNIRQSGIPGVDPNRTPPAIKGLAITGALVALAGLVLMGLDLLQPVTKG